MQFKSYILAFALMLGFALSCGRDDDADPVILFVTPNTSEATAGNAIYFDISTWTINREIVSLEVISFDKTYGSQQIYSGQPMTQRYEYRIDYRLPIYFEDQSVEFTFYATDDKGNRQDISVDILVLSNDRPLDELSGITLYSPLSGRHDAFSFKLQQSVNTQDVDPNLCDIYVPLVDQNSEDIPRLWQSKTDLQFVKLNRFAYAKATYKSVALAYESAVISPMVDDLHNEDIIIVGRNDRAIAVIRIANIYDDEGVESDRYDINLKVLPTDSEEEKEEEETPPTEVVE